MSDFAFTPSESLLLASVASFLKLVPRDRAEVMLSALIVTHFIQVTKDDTAALRAVEGFCKFLDLSAETVVMAAVHNKDIAEAMLTLKGEKDGDAPNQAR